MAEGGWTYRDAAAAAAAARWMLYGHALVTAALAVVQLIAGQSYDSQWILAIGLLSLVQILVFLATAIFVLRWIYIANCNARALGADDLMGGPGLAVGWFFVPLLNLAMPYMTVRDMWKASARPKDWQIEPAPPVIGLWWASWLGASLLGAIAFVVDREAAKEASAAGNVFQVASEACSIAAAFLLAWIIDRIQAMQAAAWPASIYR